MENNQKYIIRCDRAGVFYAEVKERRGSEADLVNVRRIHAWSGAASLSQMALEGLSSDSRVTMVVPEMTVLGIIELIPCSEAAVKSLDGVKVWKV